VPPSHAKTAAQPAATVKREEAASITTYLEDRYNVELPTSTSVRLVDGLANDAPKTWPAALLIGRTALYVGSRRVLDLSCSVDGRPCPAPGARRPVGQQQITIGFDDLEPPARGQHIATATVAALHQTGKAWSGRQVLVLCDRRIAWLTIYQVMETLRGAGAQPELAAISDAGEVVWLAKSAVLDDNKAYQGRPGGHAKDEVIPDDLQAVNVLLGRAGTSLQLVGAEKGVQTHALTGRRGKALTNWSRRILASQPGVRGISLLIDEQVAFDEVVSAVDAVRDDHGGQTRGGVRSDEGLRLFAMIDLRWAGEGAVREQAGAVEQEKPPLKPAAEDLVERAVPPVVAVEPLRVDTPAVGQPVHMELNHLILGLQPHAPIAPPTGGGPVQP
jgi:biopolymer transport protein ExbD